MCLVHSRFYILTFAFELLRSSMHISQTLDVVDTEVMRLSLPFLRKRSHVVEVICCESYIFVLTHNGLCAAFTAQGRRLGLLNVEHDEVVRSLFYNKTNRSIISVSVFNRDKYSSLHCRSTSLVHFALGNGAAAGFPLFVTENLQWPGALLPAVMSFKLNLCFVCNRLCRVRRCELSCAYIQRFNPDLPRVGP